VSTVDGAGNGVTGKVTPISAVATKGFLELAASPTDPDPLAQAIANTKEGAVMLFKGPFKGFQVSRNQFESIGIVARGSSVTAALQVITTLLADPRDDTEIRLVYSAE
jgi:cytochrome-b5 reductase